jgi:RNA polymerase sigma-70 factor (ECF subfamily)
MRSDDAGAFAALVEPHRRELHVHCYRMLASFEDAQDMTQEALLRAWRRRDTFEGRASVRAWLYRIATNVCLDFLERRPDRAHVPLPDESNGTAEITWLQPYPDSLLSTVAAPEDEPGAAVVTRETIELAFLVAVQHLPPRQRAVLVLRDVLGWSAKQTASLLDSTVPSTNSALQRARETMRRHLRDPRLDWRSPPGSADDERRLVQQYMDATDRGDAAAIAALLDDEVRFAMPPEPGTWVGRDVVVESWVTGGFGSQMFGRFRTMATRANRQPAVVCYVRRPGDSEFRALAVDVLRARHGLITEITTFDGAVVASFGLPETLGGDVPGA